MKEDSDNFLTTVEKPFIVILKWLGSYITVELKGNREYRGILKGYDEHMNIVLEEAEEIENGSPKRNLGKIVIRGDNIIFISFSHLSN